MKLGDFPLDGPLDGLHCQDCCVNVQSFIQVVLVLQLWDFHNNPLDGLSDGLLV